MSAHWTTYAQTAIGVALLVVTGLYVRFTYLLMKSAVAQAKAATEAAHAALEQNAWDRLQRYVPIETAIAEAEPRLRSWLQHYEGMDLASFIGDTDAKKLAIFTSNTLRVAVEASIALSPSLYERMIGLADNVQPLQLTVALAVSESRTDRLMTREFETAKNHAKVALEMATEATRIVTPILERAKKQLGASL